MKNKVLVITVHPDDETLGCGGTLLKYKDNWDEIHWLICTNIDSSHEYYSIRQKEIKQVSTMYGFDSVHNLNLNTMKVDQYAMSDLIEKISLVVNKVKPNIMFLPFKTDVHSDHRVIFNASYSCTKSFRYSFIKKIYMMEVLSETEFSPSTKEDAFVPNVFVNISKYIDKKIEIMKLFKSEIKAHPFPRSEEAMRALSMYRGATCGYSYAEAFILLKQVIE